MSDTHKTRVVSGAVLTVLLILFGAFGGILLLAGCAALSVLGIREFYNATGVTDSIWRVTGMALTILLSVFLLFLKEKAVFFFATFGLLIFFTVLVMEYPSYRLKDLTAAYLGFMYVPVLFSFLYLIRTGSNGVLLFFFVFISSWIGDTAAYLVGRKIGAHKMAPLLSPKKSWEGFLGGISGSALVGLLFGILFRHSLSAVSLPVLTCFLAAAVGSALSVIGDLSASAVKREFGIKDYSDLIPGHGGVLDRFDSVLFAAPFVYFVFHMMEKAV